MRCLRHRCCGEVVKVKSLILHISYPDRPRPFSYVLYIFRFLESRVYLDPSSRFRPDPKLDLQISFRFLFCADCLLVSWPTMLPALALDTLLSSITWREQFIVSCLGNHPLRSFVQRSADNLHGLRWHVVSVFCCEVLPLENMLNIGTLTSSDCCLQRSKKTRRN